LAPLGIFASNLYISFNKPAINDLNFNAMSLAYLSVFEAQQTTSFTPDTTAPTLISYDLDMNAGTLRLFFSETMNVYQATIWDVTIQEAATQAAGTFRTLTSTTVAISTSPARIVTYKLGEDDMNAIKLIDMQVASSSVTCYLIFPETLANDLSALEIPIVPLLDTSSPMAVTTFTADTTSPSLVTYDLDMTLRTLTLNYNEPVRASSLLTAYIVLQDNVDILNNGGGTATLSSSSTTASSSALSIVIDLSEEDFNSIKLSPGLALSSSSTFLRSEDYQARNAISDMIVPPNYMAPIVDGSAVSPTTFTPDSAPPSFRNFAIDMDSGLLTLTFSEPCDASTLNVTKLNLQSTAATITCNEFGICSVAGEPASTLYTLTSGASAVVPTDAAVLYVNVGVDDLNNIKITDDFYTALNTSFLGVNEGMVYDIADFSALGTLTNNPLVAIALTDALPATSFTPDTTAPLLQLFALNMNTGYITLTFDEPVRASSFNATGITLHSLADQTGVVYQLSTESKTYSSNGLTLEVLLAYDDLNALKQYTSSFLSVDTTFIATTALAVSDMAGNALTMADVATAKQAYFHTSDTTSPKLLSWDFDYLNYNMTFYFDEPVNPTTFDAAGITIQDGQTAVYSLTLQVSRDSPTLRRHGSYARRSNGLLVPLSSTAASFVYTCVRAPPPLFTHVCGMREECVCPPPLLS